MDESEIKSVLQEERQKTDESLNAERDKTNESIDRKNAATEHQTDKTVTQERAKADEQTEASRQRDDSNRRIDDRLLNERERADIAVEQERQQSDQALEHERESKSALASQLLEDERQRTDESLLVERIRADLVVEAAASLLSSEMSEHSKTKISLTTRDEFLAIVSHDLRNPIGTASSYASLLLDDPSHKTMSSEIRHGLEVIHRNAEKSLRLIGDLLDMERVAHGKLLLDSKLHNLEGLLKEAIESFAPTALAQKIALKLVPSKTSVDVVCDRDRILQVISNLVGNALKFTPEGGTIRLGMDVSPQEVQVSVSDTGSGIPKDKLKSIFDRFAQIGSSDRSGLGLGLYISRMLVEAHHGRLWVESTVGVGTVFRFSIPR